MAVVNEHGASATTLQEYLERLRAAYREIDPDWNLEPESPDGMALAIWSELLANLDEQVLNAYRSVDPNTAVGQQLDRIAFLTGVTRQRATHSTATVIFSGIDGTVIPAGTRVRNTQTDTLWATDGYATISGGTAAVGVTCLTAGAQPAAAGTLTVIATPVGGVQSVTNAAAASLGRDAESDTMLRVRRNLSVARPSNNQVGSIFAALADVEGVKRVRVYENAEPTTDANGLAPHSIAVIVDGGEEERIAREIADHKSPGVGLNAGSDFANKIQIETQTRRGNPLTVTFFRPVHVDVHVAVSVSGHLRPGVEGDIKDAIIAYANATLFDTDGTGFDRTGFDIGDTIAAGKLYTPVNRVVADDGYTMSVKIGTESGDVTRDTLDPGFNGLGVFSRDNITVTIV